MQSVFVLDKNKQPLMPCQPARARRLLKSGKAAVFRRYPFTIILKEREGGVLQQTELKIDPGSKTTGIALTVETKRGPRVVWAAELQHRGATIRDNLQSRAQLRRGRRGRKTRYRPARWANRRNKKRGWLAPSLMHRVHTTNTWVQRIARLAPVGAIGQELVKFDMQALANPEIDGVEYQQGALFGYEVREYLLEKWGRKCAYCSKKDVPLEIEHIIPKSRGGTNKVSNLTLACRGCNQRKGNKTAAEFGHPDIAKTAGKAMKDAAAVNATRWRLYNTLKDTGIPTFAASGGRTKFNRVKQGYPKAHWIDAASVGPSGERVYINPAHRALTIKAIGHGTRQMCQTNKYGFPIRHRQRKKKHYGFQTGDIVKVDLPDGSTVTGRVTCRADGRFYIQRGAKRIGFSYKRCNIVQHADGYNYVAQSPVEQGKVARSGACRQC